MARISICAFGCKVNQYEAEQAAERARAAGHEVVQFGEQADIQIVHTCAVTAAAVRDGRQALRAARRTNPEGAIIATGCAVRADVARLLPDGGVRTAANLLEALELAEMAAPQAQPDAPLPGGRTRALVKIQDGCTFRCAYCIVPNARPQEQSRPMDDVLQEATRRVAEGHAEIVLTGVRITGYRPGGRLGLPELIRRLGELPGLERVRLTSLYPSEAGEGLLQAIAETPNACRHLHMSMQSGDDEVLRRMGRRYTVAQYRKIVDRAREAIPGVAITTDVIAGFPGETPGQFENTCLIMQDVGFARAHVFGYSPRPGTRGAELDGRIPADETKRRVHRLIEIAARTGLAWRSKLVGSVQKVIAEQVKDGLWHGVTDTYVDTVLEGPADLRGQVAEVLITATTPNGLRGRLTRISARQEE